jgi:parallel beta-helix repeat protein
MTRILVKRGLKEKLSTLMQGEFGYATDTEELFIGDTSKGNVQISKKEYVDSEIARVDAEIVRVDAQLADIAYSVKDKVTSQIQQSIDDNHLKGVIYFPNTDTNIYTLTDTLKIPSNTSILFADGVTLKLDNGINKPLIENSDKTNGNTKISIVGGIFDMNIANQTIQTPAISMHRVSYSYFGKMEVTGTKFVSYVGIGAFDMYLSDYNIIEDCKLYNSADEGLYLRECNHCKVMRGEFYNCPNGSGVASEKGSFNEFIGVHSYGNSGSNISINGLYSKILHCTSEDGLGFNGITLGHPDSPASYSIVSGCLVRNNKNGIRILGSGVGVVVSKNTLIDNNFDSTAIAIGISDSSSDCVVTDNYIFNNWLGIYISTGVRGNVIKNNIVKNSKGTGITINASENCIIEGNLCENNALNGTGYGVYVSTTSKNNIISNNRCFDSQGTKTQQRGIYCDGTKNVISNNIVFGNSVTQLTAATGNFLSNNIMSSTDAMRFDVNLSDATSTVITNGNINTDSKISFVPKTSTAIDRNIYQSAITNGSVTLTHLAGTGDIISVSIN